MKWKEESQCLRKINGGKECATLCTGCFEMYKKQLESPSTEVGQQGEWQLCPKCYGYGHLARYNSPALSTTTHPVCDVCMGAKILAKPITDEYAASLRKERDELKEKVEWWKKETNTYREGCRNRDAQIGELNLSNEAKEKEIAELRAKINTVNHLNTGSKDAKRQKY